MENKQKNQKINFLDQFAPLVLSFLIIIYFFYGFILMKIVQVLEVLRVTLV